MIWSFFNQNAIGVKQRRPGAAGSTNHETGSEQPSDGPFVCDLLCDCLGYLLPHQQEPDDQAHARPADVASLCDRVFRHVDRLPQVALSRERRMAGIASLSDRQYAIFFLGKHCASVDTAYECQHSGFVGSDSLHTAAAVLSPARSFIRMQADRYLSRFSRCASGGVQRCVCPEAEPHWGRACSDGRSVLGSLRLSCKTHSGAL